MLDPVQRPPGQARSLRRLPWLNLLGVAAVCVAATLVTAKNLQGEPADEILNVSYDPTRELYAALDAQFVGAYEQRTGISLHIKQSHGGSSRQARSVIDGSQAADVVTLALPTDIEALVRRGLIATGWQARLPNNSVPYISTIVFVVRKGNPKAIHDWPDLVKGDVAVVTPNPRTSGNGKLSLLAAWGAVTTRGGSANQALAYLKALFRHIAVFDAGARGAATSFAIEKIGDVHLTWENEALREVAANKDELELVYPPVSIRAEPAVAWVDANLRSQKTATYAEAYLRYLFSDTGQETIAHFGYRPVSPKIAAKYASRFGVVKLFPVTAIAKDWDDAREKFFADNGILDAIAPAKTN